MKRRPRGGLPKRRPPRRVPGHPELVPPWRAAIADGSASARCDELVRRTHAERGIPPRLAEALLRSLTARC